MLRLMIGKAGAGKTAAIINEIKRDMASAHGRALMIVPEQYSHEAERELCRVCGDRLSMYAEVLSCARDRRKARRRSRAVAR